MLITLGRWVRGDISQCYCLTTETLTHDDRFCRCTNFCRLVYNLWLDHWAASCKCTKWLFVNVHPLHLRRNFWRKWENTTSFIISTLIISDEKMRLCDTKMERHVWSKRTSEVRRKLAVGYSLHFSLGKLSARGLKIFSEILGELVN